MLKFARNIFLPAQFLIFSAFLFQAYSQQPFQQRVDHFINLALDDVRHVITGTDSLVYYNRSEDTLRYVFFHLWPEGLQPGSSLSEHLLMHGDGRLNFAGQSETGSMTGVVFRFNGRGLRWEHHEGIREICRVDLLQPLMPDSQLAINIMFRLQVPELTVTDLSHDRQAYFLAHWFPCPVVYNSNGWQIMPVHQQGRLSGESGNFEVNITLPRNYIVATSGIRDENPDEEKFKQNLLEKTRKTNRWGKRESAGFPASVIKTKTLKFYRNNTSDFALCFDKRFQFLQDTLNTGTGKEDSGFIMLNLYFTVFEAEYWSNAIPVIKDALRYMINNVGDYPFESISFVQTSWLPESRAYPGMIRIGSVMAPYLLEQSIVYGIADHWFNAAVTVDHYRNPWLSRGLPGYYAMQYLRDHFPDSISLQDIFLDPGVKINVAGLKDIPFNRLEYYKMALLNRNLFQPLMLPADEFSPREYSVFAELKSPFSFSTLAGSMGEEQFRSLVKIYYQNNCGKIASADAITSLIESTSGIETAKWFTEGMLNQPKMPDYKVSSVNRTSDGFSLKVKNVAGVAVPYPVTRVTPGGDITNWFSGHQDDIIIHFSDTAHTTKKFIIDKDFYTPELKRNNNSIRTKGLFRKLETLKLVSVVTAPNPYKTQLIVSPVIGWNNSNGIMAGLASYSNPVIRPETEYLLMPLYGFRNGHIAGTARLLHNITPLNGFLSKVVIGADLKRYGLSNEHLTLSWNRIMPFIEAHLKSSGRPDQGQHMIRFRSVIVGKDSDIEIKDSVISIYISGGMDKYVMNEIMWRHRVARIINPFTLQAALQQCGGTLRLITENNFLFSYSRPAKGFSMRLFGGLMFLYDDNNNEVYTKFTTSGIAKNYPKTTVVHDPWFDYLYLSRNQASGILRQHMYITDGGFKRATTVGNNNRWMLTANISTTLPGIIPFDIWLDAGLFADEAKEQFFGFQFLYSAGIKLSIIRNVAEIYFPFPFVESKAIADFEQLNKIDLNYFNKIRFVFNLHHLNPLTLPAKVRIK